MTDTTPPVHLRLRGSCDEGAERRALRAVLDATHLLGLATGTHLRKLRELNDPLVGLQARLQEAELRARLAWETAELLGSRFAKIPEKHRPYFTPLSASASSRSGTCLPGTPERLPVSFSSARIPS